MLKARIKIFSVADKKTEITRFLYVEQGKVNYVREIKEEIEKLFFPALLIKKHIVRITDLDGYIISDWLQASEVVNGKLTVYICAEPCEKCSGNEVVEYTYEEEESKELSIKVELPLIKEEERKTKLVLPIKQTNNCLRKGSVHSGKQERNNLVENSSHNNQESTKNKGYDILENIIAKNESDRKNTIVSTASTSSQELSDSKESMSNYTTSADEGASDSSTGRKYLLKRPVNIQPIRKMQAPQSRYAKRK